MASLIPPLELLPLVGVPGSTAKFANLIVGRAGSSFSELFRPEAFEGSVAKPARRKPGAEEESTGSVTTSSSLLFNENGCTVAIFRGGTESRIASRMLVTICEASESGREEETVGVSEELKNGWVNSEGTSVKGPSGTSVSKKDSNGSIGSSSGSS